jgi:hypothetical protein
VTWRRSLPRLWAPCSASPAGFGLFTVASQDGSASQPSAWWPIAVVAGTVIVVAVLTIIPARIGARRPVTEILQSGVA